MVRIFLSLILLLCIPRCVIAACNGSAIFEGGVSLDAGISFTEQVNASDTLFIGGELCPQQSHLGQTADLFVAFQIGNDIYFLNSADQLIDYDGSNLSPYRDGIVLSESHSLNVFSGIVGNAIEQVKLYVAYAINNTFYLDELPTSFSITDHSSLTALSFFPQRDATTAAAGGPIRVGFDRALSNASIQPGDLKVFGRWSGVMSGELALVDNGKTLHFSPSRSFSAGEWVTVAIAGQAITANDGSTLSGGYSWSFWVEAAPAILDFAEAAVVSARVAGSTAQIQTYGAYAGDMNQDGWSDFVVPNELSNDLRIFLNDGLGGYGDFTIVPIAGANKPSPNEGADLDGDGDIDFVVGSAWGNFVHVFMGDGQGGLLQTQNLDAGERVRGVCLLDFENDGDADIVATAYVGNQVSLFRNNGSGAFENAGVMSVGEGEWSCAAADMNQDGLTDVVIGARDSAELIVLTSNGNGSFSEASRISANGDPWMLAAGDLDRDGDVDIAAANADAKSLTVAMGNGAGQLSAPVSYSLAVNNEGFPLAVDMGDLDGDGDLDLVTSDYRTRLFLIHENNGAGVFTRLPSQLIAPQAASCAILHDRDNDGDLDITGIDEESDVLLLYTH